MAKWEDGKDVTSFDGMFDLVVQEHFLSVCKDDSPPQTHSSDHRPKSPVKTEESRRCYQCNSTDHLKNKCLMLAASRQPTAHVSSVVLSTEVPQTMQSYHIGSVRLASTDPDMKHARVVEINGRECLGWKDKGGQLFLIK